MGGGNGLSRMIGSRSRSGREMPGAGEAGVVDEEGKKQKIQKRVVMTRGTTGMGAIKTDLSTAAQNWNENVNVSRPSSLFHSILRVASGSLAVLSIASSY